MGKPKVWYLPTQSHSERVFRPETFRRMCEQFNVTINRKAENLTSEEVAEKIEAFDGIVSGWGTPPFSDEALSCAKKLRVIAHSAGSVKHLFPGDTWEKHIVARSVCVFSANHAIAYNVAESTLGMMIACSHYFQEHANAFRETGAWGGPNVPRNFPTVNGSVVGIVSASKVGREVIKLLWPFDCQVLVYDPYLSDWEAGALGVVKVLLDDLFAYSDFVSVHAPSTPETAKMIKARHLRKMKDGTVLVNTSRGAVIDEAGLVKELRRGRIRAFLDVTDPEPPAKDSELRRLPNVLVLPHLSGAGTYGYLKIGNVTLEALEDFFTGRPVREAIRYEEYHTLA